MKKIFALLLVFSMCACSQVKVHNMDRQIDEYENLAKSKTVQVFDKPYMGSTVRELDIRSPLFDKKALLSQCGTITEIAQSIEMLFPTMSFQVDGYDTQSYRIFYDGNLKGLLDSVSTATGYGWTFADNTVTFSKVISKTYTIMAIPGTNSYTNTLTNKNKSSDTSTNSGLGQTVSSGDSSADTAQTIKSNYSYDTYKEIVADIKGLLSNKGTVTANQGAGTVTVRDSADKIKLVDNYISEINKKMSRQVAINVQVYSLELNDDSEIGFNLNALFENADLSIIAGNAFTGSNNLTASIVSGKLKGSNATLNALREFGKASQVTSASGIVMSNQPLPTLAVNRTAYLASMSTSTTEYGQTTDLIPGEITTGFSMTVTPHILERREVILQYNVHLSSLEDMQRFSTDTVAVDLPQTNNRSFSQRMRMKMGQTLVLAGYAQENKSNSTKGGFLFGGNSASDGKSILIITVSVEGADI